MFTLQMTQSSYTDAHLQVQQLSHAAKDNRCKYGFLMYPSAAATLCMNG